MLNDKEVHYDSGLACPFRDDFCITFNGGISNLVTTTREVSFWQAIKDIFVGIYKGFMRTIGQ